MDGGARRGRHNEPQVHASSTGRYPLNDVHQNNRIPLSTGNDRYRPSALASVPTTPRGSAGSAQYSTYYQEPTAAFAATGMSSAGMSYGGDYGSDARQSSTFSNYSSAPVMYNVAQPNAATGQVYDNPAFGSRQQQSGLQILTPDVASTYFGSDGSGPSSQSQVQHPNVYPQTSSLGFPGSMPGVNSMQAAPAEADVSMTEDSGYGANALEERWINYKRQMESVFLDISNGALQNASETLSTVSKWLLSQVLDLGLTTDDETLHSDRVQLWKNFNNAWLALGTAQKDGMLTGQPPDTLLSRDTIQDMVDELIHLDNGLERHGLVDYGVGVWEERIVDLFSDCMLLFSDTEERRSASH